MIRLLHYDGIKDLSYTKQSSWVDIPHAGWNVAFLLSFLTSLHMGNMKKQVQR